MDPIIIVGGTIILVIIGAFVWYRIAQNKREQAFNEKLGQLLESERLISIAQRDNKKKWGCLSAFSALALLGNSIYAVIFFFNAASGNPSMIFPTVLSILGAVFAGFIYWKHKRWAVYGYITLILPMGLINFINLGLAAIVQGIIPILLLVAAVRPVWDQMDPPKVKNSALSPAETPIPPNLQPFGARLEIVKGEQSGSVIPIQGNFYIGRGSENQFRLSEARISRQHVCFKYAQGAWFIQDQNSIDGTFVNGQNVPATRLNPGDQIRIGDTEFIFQV